MARNFRMPTLSRLLAADALSCSVLGALLVAISGPIGLWTDIPAPLLFWAGVLLLPIAAFMAITARLASPPTWATGNVIFGNCLWVVMSLALPLAGTIAPNPLGWAFMVGQAGFVAMMALAEFSAARPAASSV